MIRLLILAKDLGETSLRKQGSQNAQLFRQPLPNSIKGSAFVIFWICLFKRDGPLVDEEEQRMALVVGRKEPSHGSRVPRASDTESEMLDLGAETRIAGGI